ncbi:C5a anaphylatoxin chemotactic receptor 1-like [Festucalex cinctus]
MEDHYNFSDLDESNYSIPDFNDTNDNMEPEILPVQIVALTLYALIVLFGVPGNAIVIWVTGFKMPPSVPTIFFLNLALADLLCCLSLPLHMMLIAKSDLWQFGPVACKLVKGLFYLVKYCSLLQLVFVSLDRWLLVVIPMWCHKHRRPKYAVLVCVAVWCLALIGNIPQFMYHKEVIVGVQRSECLMINSMRRFSLIITFRFLLEFLLPFLIISSCHLMVYRRARSNVATSRTRSKRTLKVIVALVLSFFLCWLPMYIVKFLMLMIPLHSPHIPYMYRAHVLTLCLPYFNCCLNPLLYVCLGQGFKDSMNRSLCNILHLLSEDHTPRTNIAAHDGAKVRRN